MTVQSVPVSLVTLTGTKSFYCFSIILSVFVYFPDNFSLMVHGTEQTWTQDRIDLTHTQRIHTALA